MRLATEEDRRSGRVLLWADSGASLRRLALGVGVAALLGIGFGIAIGLVPLVNAALAPPFGALDPGIRADMHALILDVWRQGAMQIFLITHDLQEGFALGTRLLVLNHVREDPQAP